MTTSPAPLVAAPEALQLELTRERVQSARRINLVRLWGVSGFFALFLVLGGVLRLPAWTGNLGIFTVYWAITVLVFWASHRFDLIARSARFTIALLDMPMVFFLQWATFATSPSASGIAGFTVGVYVLLVILAALSLERWSIVFTAAVGAGLEVLLQHLAGVSEGGMASTVILMGLTAVACSYARTRLVELVTRVDREIAAQRQAERALRQSDRMASLGTLAAGVAHEINTPLTYVVTNLALIAERLAPAAPGARPDAATRTGIEARAAEAEETLALARSGLDALVSLARGLPDELRHTFGNGLTTTLYALGMVEQQLAALAKESRATGPFDDLLQQAREGAERVRTIVRDLKTFSHPDDEAAVKPVDLQRVVRSSINLASVEIRERASLRTEFGATPYVVGNEARLGQVFINLLLNAAQAIPEGGANRHEIHITTRSDAAGRAVVEVSDTGSGIAPELLGRIFDPFFTTKPVGVGTGLGLSICHGIVTALGGELSVESEVGRGSTFRVTLPPAPAVAVAAMPSAAAPPASAAPEPQPRVGHIMVVDDDALVGDVIRVSLAAEHDVVVATAASEVVQRIATGERFDLILCDLMMPVMTGMDLHAELERVDPAQASRMVFLTGGAFTPRAREFLSRVTNPKLEKPFDPQGLRNFVRDRVTASEGRRATSTRAPSGPSAPAPRPRARA
jgi:signal transduction histidine kinase/ActR/RegA family two-component response regulator